MGPSRTSAGLSIQDPGLVEMEHPKISNSVLITTSPLDVRIQVERIDLARINTTKLHGRIVFLVCQAGSILILLAVLPPIVCMAVGQPELITPYAGNLGYYTPLIPWGMSIYLLVLRPIDSHLIHRSSSLLACFYVLGACVFGTAVAVPSMARGLDGSRVIKAIGNAFMAVMFTAGT